MRGNRRFIHLRYVSYMLAIHSLRLYRNKLKSPNVTDFLKEEAHRIAVYEIGDIGNGPSHGRSIMR